MARDIRQYWDDQARRHQTDPRATTQDFWMRQIEVGAIADALASLPGGARVLDIGCGNGYGTIRVAERVPHVHFVGGDFSTDMIEAARALSREQPDHVRRRVTFEELDVRDLSQHAATFDAVVSDRCLINLPTEEEQWTAVDQIARSLRSGGAYLALENFLEGQERLNALREQMGLPPIAIRWHNRFFAEASFLSKADQWFDVKRVTPISSLYYLVTRVVYSKLCQLEGREPDYDHPIYEVATKLPFEGNYGPIKLIELVRRAA